MVVSCSFKAIAGTPCSHDRRDQSKSVSIVLCKTESHKSLWSFTGVTGEQELILLRAAIFATQQDISNLTICPFHRSELGLVENATENMKGKKQLQNSGCYKSKKVSMFMSFIPFYYIDTSVLLQNIEIHQS